MERLSGDDRKAFSVRACSVSELDDASFGTCNDVNAFDRESFGKAVPFSDTMLKNEHRPQ
jgi:hypothetical protein